VILQKEAFEALLPSEQAEQEKAQGATAWIRPEYLLLFEREGSQLEISLSIRNRLAHLLAKPLGVSASSLEKAWGAKESGDISKPDGTTPIPEVWPETVVYPEVLNELLGEFLDPHLVVITPAQAVVSTVHTVTTYLTDCIDDWLPFVYITAGAKDSGKTKLLSLFFELVYRADLSGNPSAASIYYALQEGTYTILIDEVDKNEQRREAILDLINFSSSRATAWVSRADPDKGIRKKYCTFCPKILAGNGSIRDTSASRCIRLQMQRKPPGGPIVRITRKDRARFAVHRSKMMRIAQEIGPKLSDYDIDTLRLPGGLYNREADNWSLLFITAELIGGDWPKLLRCAFQQLCPPRNPDTADDTDESELGEPLIRDLARIWVKTREQEFYSSEVLRQKLKSFKDRPWLTMNKGLGLNTHKLGSLLRAFGVKSIQRRLGGGDRDRGYLLKDLLPLFRSYASDIWDTPPDDEEPEPPPSPKPEPPEKEEKPSNSSPGVVRSVPPVPPCADQVSEPIGRVARIFEQSGPARIDSRSVSPLSPSESTAEMGVEHMARFEPPSEHKCEVLIPSSTAQADFCIATHPELFVSRDLETFYPWDAEEQPKQSDPNQLKRREKRGLAHP
jgi:hypothetical protein